MTTTDDLAAEHPEIVAVCAKGFGSKPLLQEIEEKGFEILDDALSDGDIGLVAFPRVRPISQIWAVPVEGCRRV